MDSFRIQSLIKERKIVKVSDVDTNETYVQVGVFQAGNRKIGPSNPNTYPPYAMTLNDIIASSGGGSAFQYEIGQYVASEGGVIAHRWWSTTPFGPPTAGTVQNYLVLDTTNLSTAAAYATLNVDIPNVESLWNGATNTTNLIAAGALSGITAGTAAVLCDSSTNAGKSDWYLPALYEWTNVYSNILNIAQGIDVAGGTKLEFDRFWCSNEINSNTGQIFTFSNGTYGAQAKTNTSLLRVRAMRKFSI